MPPRGRVPKSSRKVLRFEVGCSVRVRKGSWGLRVKVRRCAQVVFEPREEVDFSLEGLLNGGDGLTRRIQWVALAPHVQKEIALQVRHVEWLGALLPGTSREIAGLPPITSDDLAYLLEQGLVLREDLPGDWLDRDVRTGKVHWHPLASLLHGHSRWEGVDTVKNMKDTGTTTGRELRELLGAPPPETVQCGDDPSAWIELPVPQASQFDRLLAQRATCRNFDHQRPVPLHTLSRVMQRVFGAQGAVQATPDTTFLKKNVPSGGGLHPIEAFMLVQNVDGIAPGLYHYHPVAHRLEPIDFPAESLAKLSMDFVAQQHWFSNAPVLVVMVARFARTFWKYRRHAKSYRVVLMEAGHLSQMLYLAATEEGMGAFVTAAINEVEIEQAFGLDSLCEGVLSVSGFGWRGSTMETAELDPSGAVWAST